MKEELLDILQCPVCHGRRLRLLDRVEDANEIRTATVVCDACRTRFPVEKGIVNLMPDPRQAVVSEIKGWSDKIDLDELDEAGHDLQRRTMLALPYLDEELDTEEAGRKQWAAFGRNFERFALQGDLRGKRVLDVGAGRCWTSAAMVEMGAEVVALDILTKMYIGLETADLFLSEKGIFMERIQGDMHQLPFKDGTFDLVVESASAHHAEEPEVFFAEVFRVLAPGGRLAIVSEPIAWRGDEPPPEVADGITEQMIGVNGWFRLFDAAGLIPEECEVEMGRGLCCVLSKRGERPPALERARSLRHRAYAVTSFLYWNLVALRGSVGPWLKGVPGKLKGLVRRLIITLSLPTSPAVFNARPDYLKAAWLGRGTPPTSVSPGTADGSRWLGAGWYKPDPRISVAVRRAYRAADLVLSVPPQAARLVVRLGLLEECGFEMPVAVEVRVGGVPAATIDLERVGMVTREVDIPEGLRGEGILRVSLRVRRAKPTPVDSGILPLPGGGPRGGKGRSFLPRVADPRTLGVVVEQLSVVPLD